MRHDSVIITGGLGFVGAAVSEYLLSKGSKVTIVDSMVSNVVAPELLTTKYGSCKVIQSSVRDFFQGGADVSDHDLLIHAASFVGPALVIRYQGLIGESIVSDAFRIIRTCRRSDLPLVFISSAEVYGKSGILREDSEIRVPPYYNARIEYALAKLTSEAMVLNSQDYGLRGAVIRPFNVAGPRQSRAGGFVMPTFVQQALGNMPLTVFGSGKQKRAFLGTNDLARFLDEFIDGRVLRDHKIYNVGNPGNATTIGDLARRVIELLGSESRIEYIDPKSVYGPLYDEAESFEKLPDIANAAALGWSPKQTLDEIILDTADFHRTNKDTRGADARN